MLETQDPDTVNAAVADSSGNSNLDESALAKNALAESFEGGRRNCQ
jgi:hypothetical protein